MDKQLFRSRQNKMIAGVCGGLGEYFFIDPTIIRIIWVAVALALFPWVIIAYIIAAIVMPEGKALNSDSEQEQGQEDAYNPENSDTQKDNSVNTNRDIQKYDTQKTRVVIGATLVGLGALFLAKEFLFFDMKYLWPLAFIGIGTLIIYRGGRK